MENQTKEPALVLDDMALEQDIIAEEMLKRERVCHIVGQLEGMAQAMMCMGAEKKQLGANLSVLADDLRDVLEMNDEEEEETEEEVGEEEPDSNSIPLEKNQPDTIPYDEIKEKF